MHFDHQIHNHRKIVDAYFNDPCHSADKMDFPGLSTDDAVALIKGCMGWGFTQQLGIKPDRALGMIDHEYSHKAIEAKASLIAYLSHEGLLPDHLPEKQFNTCLTRAVLYAYGITVPLIAHGLGLEGAAIPLETCIRQEMADLAGLSDPEATTGVMPRRPGYGSVDRAGKRPGCFPACIC